MPNTKWDANRWSLEESDVLNKLAVLRGSADESARHVRGLYVTFLLFAFYVAVIVFSTTDQQLLKETGARLPLLNVELPLLGFFIVIPWLVFIFHVHLVTHFFLLSRKLHNLNQAIASLPEDIQRTHRELPFPLVFSYMIVGRHHPFLLRWAFSTTVIVTVVIVPIVLLLVIQWKFLPYHSRWITLNHQIVFVLDLLLLWALWPRMKRQRWQMFRVFVAGVSTIVILLVSTVLLVPPGGVIERFLGKQIQFNYILHRNLDLREKTLMKSEPPPELIAAYKVAGDSSEKVWLDHGKPLDLQKRDLRDANFYRATLWNVDLRGAKLQGADFQEAQLQGANLQRAELQGAKLQRAELQGADLEWARLQGADLTEAQLQGADLTEAKLQGADLTAARLQGANLREAELQSANLKGADLQITFLYGANLQGADLRGANLREAELQGAKLQRAELQGAYLERAKLQSTFLNGANLKRADLRGANLREAELQGAKLQRAELQGAKLQRAELQGAYLERAKLQGANLKRAKLQGAKLQRAELQGAYLREAELQGAPLWEARLQGADLREAKLQVTDLRRAQLQGAHLGEAELQGANLRGAELQGANLRRAELQGADLRGARVYATKFAEADLSMANIHGLVSIPVSWDSLESISSITTKNWPDDARKRVQEALSRFWDIAFDLPLDKTLLAPSQATGALYDHCGLFTDWPPPLDINTFEINHAMLLTDLSCNDRYFVKSLVKRAHFKRSRTLAQALLNKADSKTCSELAELVEENRKILEYIIRQTK